MRKVKSVILSVAKDLNFPYCRHVPLKSFVLTENL
jgi:hypothetical protein